MLKAEKGSKPNEVSEFDAVTLAAPMGVRPVELPMSTSGKTPPLLSRKSRKAV